MSSIQRATEVKCAPLQRNLYDTPLLLSTSGTTDPPTSWCVTSLELPIPCSPKTFLTSPLKMEDCFGAEEPKEPMNIPAEVSAATACPFIHPVYSSPSLDLSCLTQEYKFSLLSLVKDGYLACPPCNALHFIQGAIHQTTIVYLNSPNAEPKKINANILILQFMRLGN